MKGATLNGLMDLASEAGVGGLRFVDRGEEARFVGWPELVRAARRAAGRLRAWGLPPGGRVALLYPTCPEFFDALLGTLLAGGVPVPLCPPVRLARLPEYHRRTGAMLAAAGTTLLLTDPRIGALVADSVATARQLGCAVEAARLADLPSAEPLALAAEVDDLAMVQFSSGTTGGPKPVALSHRAVVAQVEVLNAHWKSLPEVSGVSWLPLYHDMGLVGCVFTALHARKEVTLLPPEAFVARPALWLRTLSRYRGVVSPAPNFAYALCAERIRDEELEGVDLSSWRIALNGAETVSASVMRRFVERFAPWGLRPEALSPVYGLAEATLAVTFSDLERPFRSVRIDRQILSARGEVEPLEDGAEIVSVGRPLPGFEVAIRDDAGRDVGERGVGRVWARGPSLMEGYLDRPRESAEALADGWLDTGDLGFLLDGELYLTGRAKDVVVLRGRKYPPHEIEEAVRGVAGVRPGSVAAVGDAGGEGASEELVLFVERRSARGRAEGEDLVAECRVKVLEATGLAADRVVLLAPGLLPRTSSGKIRRSEALRLWKEGLLDGSEWTASPGGLAPAAGSAPPLAGHER